MSVQLSFSTKYQRWCVCLERSDIKGDKLTEDSKMIGTDERIKQNRNSNNIKYNNNIIII